MDISNICGKRSVGLSLVEALIAITIIGILTAVAIPVYSGVQKKAVYRVSVENLDWLNQAVLHHNHMVGVVSDPFDENNGDDEQGVIDLLTVVKPPDPLIPGGYPFLRPTPTLAESDDATIPRYTWNGEFFEVIPAGTPGTGVLLR